MRIDEFARRIGVSRMTVSRVLNNSSLVSASTRERVLRAMEELNYHPNILAQSLALRRVTTVAAVMLFPAHFRFPIEVIYNDPFNHGVMSGVLEAARRAGYSTLVHVEEQPERLPSLLNSGQVAAAAIAVGRDDEITRRQLTKVIEETTVPLAFPGYTAPAGLQPREDVSFLDGGDFAAAKMAVQHLLARGHRRIAFIGVDAGSYRARERQRGYEEALRNSHVDRKPEWMVTGPPTEEEGERLTKRLLCRRGKPPFSAIFAASDRAAIGALQALRGRTIGVPDEVALVGFDGIEVGQHITPALSTVRYPYFSLGYRAGLALLERLGEAGESGVASQVHLQEPRLIVRGTS